MSVSLEFTPPQGLDCRTFCKGCCYYEERDGFADHINREFGNTAQWDFKQCYASCVSKKKEQLIHEEYIRAYRIRKRELAII